MGFDFTGSVIFSDELGAQTCLGKRGMPYYQDQSPEPVREY